MVAVVIHAGPALTLYHWNESPVNSQLWEVQVPHDDGRFFHLLAM